MRDGIITPEQREAAEKILLTALWGAQDGEFSATSLKAANVMDDLLRAMDLLDGGTPVPAQLTSLAAARVAEIRNRARNLVAFHTDVDGIAHTRLTNRIAMNVVDILASVTEAPTWKQVAAIYRARNMEPSIGGVGDSIRRVLDLMASAGLVVKGTDPWRRKQEERGEYFYRLNTGFPERWPS